MKRVINIMIAVMIPLILALAWIGGEHRTESAIMEQIQNVSKDITDVTPIGERLYQGRKLDSEVPVYIALDDKPSYGGPLTVATVVDDKGTIEHVAILQSTDTSSYLDQVVGLGILRAFVKQPIDAMPQVDMISGATISSSAITRGVEQAANNIGVAKFNLPKIEMETAPATPETAKLITILLFFVAAYYLTSKHFPWDRKKTRVILMTLSVLTLGFTYGALISLSTVVTLLSGNWVKGLASYAPLFCLVLALIPFLFARKNLYCSVICPFGAVQEGLGKITGCSAPVRARWMVWLTRSWVFMLLVAAVYFHAPSDSIYEPFGKAFTFIGSGTVYALTILVVISSLLFKRPWCKLFCPATVLFDYFSFARNALLKREVVSEPKHGGSQ
ncbi:4Fe-4S binding domain-containing protein [Desulfuromusa kysingii]|uniref:4Fe-4S binding domain-containing protein n=1 Tax=Desulfuromusa kysingii TaxID=37625 RepID=A0A1H4DFI2_9BACT|nr:4Fe-4S binding protein [Desulfuromusa kysingii]SEA71511.1 4Fe-4S binding domain-containing protein [Desulfuromusa kysingii]